MLKSHLKLLNFLVYYHVRDLLYHYISKELEFCGVKSKVKEKTSISVISPQTVIRYSKKGIKIYKLSSHY